MAATAALEDMEADWTSEVQPVAPPVNLKQAIWERFELSDVMPVAVKKMDRKLLRRLLEDDDALALWKERERRRCAKSLGYYLSNYLSHQPADGRPRQPLEPWRFQVESYTDPETGREIEGLTEFLESDDNGVILKSRRLGATILVAGSFGWYAGLSEKHLGARCVAISKSQEDANDFTTYCRDIINSLPDWLRPAIGGKEGTDRANYFSFVGRSGASIRSRSSSPKAARGMTATVVFLDEQAFHKDASKIFTAAGPIAEGGGRVIIASTGNGPANTFARICRQAQKGEIPYRFLFYPYSVRPGRSKRWREEQITIYGDEARAEYPATEADALMPPDLSLLAYKPSNVDACERLGKELDAQLASGELPAPKHGVEAGVDWGANSAAVLCWPTRGGTCLYIFDELVTATDDAEVFTKNLLKKVGRYGQELDLANGDAAGNQQNKSLARLSAPRTRVKGVPFQKFRRSNIQHIRNLMARTERGDEKFTLAISPRCTVLLEQLRSLEKDHDGMPKKGNDHSHDALVSLVTHHASAYQRTYKRES